MTFDGDYLSCEPLSLPAGTALYFVIVDLCAKKDTPKILADLSKLPSLCDWRLPLHQVNYLGVAFRQAVLTRILRRAQRRPPTRPFRNFSALLTNAS